MVGVSKPIEDLGWVAGLEKCAQDNYPATVKIGKGEPDELFVVPLVRPFDPIALTLPRGTSWEEVEQRVAAAADQLLPQKDFRVTRLLNGAKNGSLYDRSGPLVVGLEVRDGRLQTASRSIAEILRKYYGAPEGLALRNFGAVVGWFTVGQLYSENVDNIMGALNRHVPRQIALGQAKVRLALQEPAA